MGINYQLAREERKGQKRKSRRLCVSKVEEGCPLCGQLRSLLRKLHSRKV